MQITLYHTLGCHLCELAETVISQVQQTSEYTDLELIKQDIADDDALVERYGVRIPVIRLDQRSDDLGWPFDAQALIDYLRH